MHSDGALAGGFRIGISPNRCEVGKRRNSYQPLPPRGRGHQYCGFGDLAGKIQRAKTRRINIAEDLVWVYLVHIAQGLGALHAKKIVHRDVKPANDCQFWAL